MTNGWREAHLNITLRLPDFNLLAHICAPLWRTPGREGGNNSPPLICGISVIRQTRVERGGEGMVEGAELCNLEDSLCWSSPALHAGAGWNSSTARAL